MTDARIIKLVVFNLQRLWQNISIKQQHCLINRRDDDQPNKSVHLSTIK